LVSYYRQGNILLLTESEVLELLGFCNKLRAKLLKVFLEVLRESEGESIDRRVHVEGALGHLSQSETRVLSEGLSLIFSLEEGYSKASALDNFKNSNWLFKEMRSLRLVPLYSEKHSESLAELFYLKKGKGGKAQFMCSEEGNYPNFFATLVRKLLPGPLSRLLTKGQGPCSSIQLKKFQEKGLTVLSVNHETLLLEKLGPSIDCLHRSVWPKIVKFFSGESFRGEFGMSSRRTALGDSKLYADPEDFKSRVKFRDAKGVY
jgi:hypothetical protein